MVYLEILIQVSRISTLQTASVSLSTPRPQVTCLTWQVSQRTHLGTATSLKACPSSEAAYPRTSWTSFLDLPEPPSLIFPVYTLVKARRAHLLASREQLSPAAVGAALPLQLLLWAAHSQNCVPSISNFCPDMSFQLRLPHFTLAWPPSFHVPTSPAQLCLIRSRGLPRDTTSILPMVLQVPAAFSCSLSFLHGTLTSLVSFLDDEPCYGSKLSHTSQYPLKFKEVGFMFSFTSLAMW